VQVVNERNLKAVRTINTPDFTSTTGFGLQDIAVDR